MVFTNKYKSKQTLGASDKKLWQILMFLNSIQQHLKIKNKVEKYLEASKTSRFSY